MRVQSSGVIYSCVTSRAVVMCGYSPGGPPAEAREEGEEEGEAAPGVVLVLRHQEGDSWGDGTRQNSFVKLCKKKVLKLCSCNF